MLFNYCLCLIISYKATPHATETFRESLFLFIGILAFLSIIFKSPLLIPLFSDPNKMHTGLLSL